jgi:hypothetical protein
MIPEPYEKLFSVLYRKTMENSIAWNVGATPNQFVVSFRNYSIGLIQGWTDYEERLYIFELYDSDGKEIDRFDIRPDNNYFASAENLYAKVRRKALRIDKAIEDIKKELDLGDED